MSINRFRLLRAARALAPAPQRPTALTAPSVGGLVEVGQTLFAVHALYDHGPITAYEMEWRVDGELVSNGPTFTLTAEDLGATISYREKGVGPAGPAVAWAAAGDMGPVQAESEGIAVGPLYDGTADSGNPSPPDPAMSIAAREAEGSKQQPSGDLHWPIHDTVMLEDTEFFVTCTLPDLDPSSPLRGLSRRVVCDVYWENDTPTTIEHQSEWTHTTAYRGVTKTLWGFKGRLRMPTDLAFIEPNGPGCQANLYIVLRPLDTEQFDPLKLGPFKFYPRKPEHGVILDLHKTEPTSSTVVREILDVMLAARTQFQNYGKFVAGEIADTGKGWQPGRLTGAAGPPVGYADIPWATWIRPKIIDGVPTTWRLGDETNLTRPQDVAYWEPRLDKIAYAGHSQDVGVTGGIISGTHICDCIIVYDHEAYCGGFPASQKVGATTYQRYGSGSGAASLVRGRIANGSPYSCGTAGPTRMRTYFGDFHDLPAKSIEQFQVVVGGTNKDISGSAVGNSFGSMNGLISERLGGQWSGLSTLQGGAAHRAIKLIAGPGAPAYVGWRTTTSCGSSNNRLLLYAGSSKAAAVAAGPIFDSGELQYVRMDELAATITANPNCVANAISAVDNHSGPDFDCTHLWLSTLKSTQASDDGAGGPIQIVGGERQLNCTLDIHANGDAWAAPDIRHNLARRECMWLNYCGAGEIALGTNDAKTNPPTPAGGPLYEVHYVGCAWYNSAEFIDIEGNSQRMGDQGGRMIGNLVGCGVSRSVVCQYGWFYATAEKGKRQVGYGYSWAEIGNLEHPATFAQSMVSPGYRVPSGDVANYRAIQAAPTNDRPDPYLTFVDPANGDFRVADPSRVLCPDGVTVAGIYAPDGANLSRLEY